MIITDLDGTLLNNKNQVSREDYQTLQQLSYKNVIRVIATGRSRYILDKVLPEDFPIDYVILSGGSGILDWQKQKLVLTREIESDSIQKTAKLLIEKKVDFMLHQPLPEDHYFYFHKNNHLNSDFDYRLKYYDNFHQRLDISEALPDSASQFVCIFPKNKYLSEDLQDSLKPLSITRATSPLDLESNWYEIRHSMATKGSAAQFLVEKLQSDIDKIVAIGNDYNDVDFLNWAQFPYVVANAPNELQQNYKTTVSNQNSAITKVCNEMFR